MVKLASAERRRHPRYPHRAPAKLCDELTGKYLPGETLNLSASGALVRVQAPTRLTPGRRVRLGIAPHASRSILRVNDMPWAVVRRCLGHDEAQHVAVEFVNTSQLAQAG